MRYDAVLPHVDVTPLWMDRRGGADAANLVAVLPDLGGLPYFVRD